MWKMQSCQKLGTRTLHKLVSLRQDPAVGKTVLLRKNRKKTTVARLGMAQDDSAELCDFF